MIEQCTATVGALTEEGGGLLLLVGPPGIGKSTLARTVQRHLVPEGALVVRATHRDLEPAMGLWSRLMSLAALDEQPSQEPTPDDRFTTVVKLLRRLAARGATPVVLDDLHAADPDSLTLLAHLAPVLSATGATIIATSRGAEAVADELGQAAHRALESQARVHVLEPLDHHLVRLWLIRHAGSSAVSASLVDAFSQESGGNPLLLERLLHDCWPPGAPPPEIAEVKRASTGPSVVERWRRELEQLPPPDRAVLAVVIESGAGASTVLVRDVVGAGFPAGGFDRLMAHGFLTVHPSNEMAVAHPAIAEALVALDGPVAPEVHERLAHRLAAAGADPRTVLTHMVRARLRFSSDQRRHTALQVVDQAERRGDIRAAAEAWDIVLAEGGATATDVLHAAESWQRAGDRRRARALAWRVASEVDPGDAATLARAAMIAADGAEFHGEATAAVGLLHRVRELLEGLDSVVSRRYLVEVLAALGPLEMTMPVTGPRPPIALDAAQLEVVDAVRWHWATRPEVAQPRAVEAERLAREIGDPLLNAVSGLVWRATHMAPDHAPQRRDRAERARRTLIGRPSQARAVHAALLDALEVGAVADVRIALGELADLAAATGDPSVRWRYAYTTAMLDDVGGRPGDAEASSDTAGRYGLLAGEPGAVIVRLEQRTLFALDRLDDLDTVLNLGDRLDSVSHPPLLAGVLYLLGELSRCNVMGARVDTAVLSDLVAHLDTRESREQNWAMIVAFSASAVAATGDVALAERLLIHTHEVREHVARESSGIVCLGHQGALRGGLQLVVGDREAGIASLRAAQQWNERAGFTRAALAARLALLEAQRRELTDVDLRRQAHDLAVTAERRGLQFLATRARRLGVGLTEVALTRRQRAVVQGLADGATYQQIADRIGYSHGTVRGEVTSIYDLLGVDHREAAVAEAEWLGLVAPSKKT
jgi:DNA-binding CsgD family transcriptional regulator/energy-coupling factor transporter ATP-binding protein EcfA2